MIRSGRAQRLNPKRLYGNDIAIVVMLACVAILLAAGRLGIPSEWLGGPCIVALMVIVGLSRLRTNRTRKLVVQHRRFLCISCLYPLQGLADEGRCPECDHPYTRAELWHMWRAWEEAYNGKPLFPDEPIEGVR